MCLESLAGSLTRVSGTCITDLKSRTANCSSHTWPFHVAWLPQNMVTSGYLDFLPGGSELQVCVPVNKVETVAS